MKFKIALRNLFRHQRRNRVALISMACGFAAINLFEGYITNAEDLFNMTCSQRAMYGQIFVQKKGAFKNGLWDDGTNAITSVEQDRLDAVMEESGKVDDSVKFLKIWGMVNNGRTNAVFSGYGYDIERGRLMRQPRWEWNTLAGEPLGNKPDGIVVGRLLGGLIGCEAQYHRSTMSLEGGYEPGIRPFHCDQPQLQLLTTNSTGQMNAATVEVQGIVDAVYREFDLRFISMPLVKAQALMGTKDITFESVRLKPNFEVRSFVNEMRSRFAKENLELEIMSWKDHPYGEMYVKSMDFLGIFKAFTLIVILTIVTLSVLSTLIRLIQERTREIGTLRALGFKQSTLMSMFLLEISILACVGNIVGMLLAGLLTLILNSAGIFYQIGFLTEKVPFHITLTLWTLVWSSLGIIVLSGLAAFIAAHRAIHRKIPLALASN